MSGDELIIETPDASIFLMFDLLILNIISISWIIRSIITETSVPLGLKSDSL